MKGTIIPAGERHQGTLWPYRIQQGIYDGIDPTDNILEGRKLEIHHDYPASLYTKCLKVIRKPRSCDWVKSRSSMSCCDGNMAVFSIRS